MLGSRKVTSLHCHAALFFLFQLQAKARQTQEFVDPALPSSTYPKFLFPLIKLFYIDARFCLLHISKTLKKQVNRYRKGYCITTILVTLPYLAHDFFHGNGAAACY